MLLLECICTPKFATSHCSPIPRTVALTLTSSTASHKSYLALTYMNHHKFQNESFPLTDSLQPASSHITSRNDLEFPESSAPDAYTLTLPHPPHIKITPRLPNSPIDSTIDSGDMTERKMVRRRSGRQIGADALREES